ncbi:hypothetical protein Scep_017610 [Stephania cephalantha]|uniref:Uncharacterized protein n=1 Tax=Stephania cephalantha TaxID=152367 RepID=A0AAP0IPW4_9MAGN
MQKWEVKFFARAPILTKREKPEGFTLCEPLGKLFVEKGLPPPSRHEYEEVLRDGVNVIVEKNFEKMVYIQVVANGF